MADAHQGQIISSHHKDNYYREHLKNLILDFISNINKERSWMKYVKEISVVADVIYFAFTTFSGNQTLGEEYNNLLLVNKDKKSLPSKIKSALMVIFHVILPHTITKSSTYLINATKNCGTITEGNKRIILICIKAFTILLRLVEKLNSVLFYLNGAYYHVSKRITSLLYLQTRPLKFDSAYNTSYSLLGWLMLTQWLIATTTFIYRAWSNSNSNVNLFLYNLLDINLVETSSNQPTQSPISGLSTYMVNSVTKGERRGGWKLNDNESGHNSQSSSSTGVYNNKALYNNDKNTNDNKGIYTDNNNEHISDFSCGDDDNVHINEDNGKPILHNGDSEDFNKDNDDGSNVNLSGNVNNNTKKNNNTNKNIKPLNKKDTINNKLSYNNTNTHSTTNKNSSDNITTNNKQLYNKNNTKLPTTLKKHSCSMCCDELVSPTSTYCGHIFCYRCITEWCSNKTECPICKREVLLSRLIPLKNFA